MKGKVRYVKRAVWWEYNERCTNTFAVLYNGDNVCIDEDEIRECYDCSHITRSLIQELSDDLRNEWIEYSEDWYGDYWLDDNLEEIV